jgi:hypothetical protein
MNIFPRIFLGLILIGPLCLSAAPDPNWLIHDRQRPQGARKSSLVQATLVANGSCSGRRCEDRPLGMSLTMRSIAKP